MSKHCARDTEVVINTGELRRIIHDAVGGRHIPSIQPGVDYALREIDFELEYLCTRPEPKGRHRAEFSTGGRLQNAYPVGTFPGYQIPEWLPWRDYSYEPREPYRVTC